MSSRHSNSKRSLSNGRGNGDPKHVRHYAWQTSSAAWQALSMTARCLEIELKMLYDGQNNGDIFLSVREAAKRLGVAGNTASKAFRELEEKGFIKPKQRGSFKWKARHATSWILTEFEHNNELPTKDFMRWRPQGKTRAQNLIPTVSEINTGMQNLIPNKPSTVSGFNTEKAQNTLVMVSDIDTQLVYHAKEKMMPCRKRKKI